MSLFETVWNIQGQGYSRKRLLLIDYYTHTPPGNDSERSKGATMRTENINKDRNTEKKRMKILLLKSRVTEMKILLEGLNSVEELSNMGIGWQRLCDLQNRRKTEWRKMKSCRDIQRTFKSSNTFTPLWETKRREYFMRLSGEVIAWNVPDTLRKP